LEGQEPILGVEVAVMVLIHLIVQEIHLYAIEREILAFRTLPPLCFVHFLIAARYPRESPRGVELFILHVISQNAQAVCEPDILNRLVLELFDEP
jgi:hypothetical protein